MRTPSTEIAQATSQNASVSQIQSMLTKQALVPPTETSLTANTIDGMLKSLGDPYAMYFDPKHFKAFNEIMPGGARWTRGCHSGTYSEKPEGLPGGGVTVLHEFCYGTPLDLAKPLAPYWKQRQWPGADYERMGNHEVGASLQWYRDTGVTSLMRRTREGQAVATGLYLFSVEDLGSGHVERGKFLIVKSDRED